MSAGHEVVIIGAGFAGLGMAVRLKQAGFGDIIVLERADDVGGTWRDNSYPGAACDVPSHLYSLSFAPNPDWSRSFSGQPEIWDYLRRVAEDFDIARHVRFGHEVISAQWQPEAGHWWIETSRDTLTARFLISATGPLSDPAIPDLPGLDRFDGPAFHSAQWNHDHDLAGRSVAVIGTGASAIQFVPQIQPVAGRLRVFQRTPPWIIPRPDRDLTDVERWAYRHIPGAQRLARSAIYWGRETYALGFVHNPRLMKVAELLARRHLRRQVPDPRLRAKLTPDYTIGCKRILLSNNYYPTLAEPNVSVVTDGITAVRPDSIVTADGAEYRADAIIFGTGFHVTDPPIAARLSDGTGRSLRQAWSGGMAAYRGTTIAGFPNLFMLCGPNTGLGYSSQVFMIEAQIRYVTEALRHARAQGVRTIAARPDVQTEYNVDLQRRMASTVWTTGGCRSWYLDSQGRNTTLWPGSTWRFARQTRRFDPDAYDLSGAEEGAAGEDHDEQYRGPVTVVLNGDEIVVDAQLAGHFDPLSGAYRWVGRLAASNEITTLFDHGRRDVRLIGPDGHSGEGVLRHPNPWGGHPVDGSGTPPFPVPSVELADH